MVGSKKRDASREKKQPVCNVRVVKCVDEGFPVHAQTQEPYRIQLADGSLSALALLSLALCLSPLPALLSILLTTSRILPPAVFEWRS